MSPSKLLCLCALKWIYLRHILFCKHFTAIPVASFVQYIWPGLSSCLASQIKTNYLPLHGYNQTILSQKCNRLFCSRYICF